MLDQLNNNNGFFTDTLAESDAELFAAISSQVMLLISQHLFESSVVR